MNGSVRLAAIIGSILTIALVSRIALWQEDLKPVIVPFDYTRDAQEILDIFKLDKYWLAASPDYDPQYMLQHKAPHKTPEDENKLHLFSLRSSDTFIGFTGYYMEDASRGRVLFVAVKRKYRGKHFGDILVQHAIKGLQDLGAQRIDLLTRTSNIAAQKLYKRNGFQETYRTDGFVYFTYIPDVKSITCDGDQSSVAVPALA